MDKTGKPKMTMMRLSDWNYSENEENPDDVLEGVFGGDGSSSGGDHW